MMQIDGQSLLGVILTKYDTSITRNYIEPTSTITSRLFIDEKAKIAIYEIELCGVGFVYLSGSVRPYGVERTVDPDSIGIGFGTASLLGQSNLSSYNNSSMTAQFLLHLSRIDPSVVPTDLKGWFE